jgi:hypothetical protein
MPSTLRTIAADLTAGLQGRAELSAVSITKDYYAELSLSDMETTKIVVIPSGEEVEKIDRLTWQHDCQIVVFIGKRCKTEQEVDDAMDLAYTVQQLVVDHDWQNAWTSDPSTPMTVEVEHNPQEALTERNVFRTVITATYRVFQT